MTTRPVALVTGTSRGLGTAIALELIACGYRVAGVSRTSNSIDHEDFTWISADVSDPASACDVVRHVIDRCDHLDLLVNNAAEMVYANCWELKESDLQRLLDTNLTAPFVLSREAAAHWQRQGRAGSIINICSIESEVAWLDPPQAGYATTKGGLAGLTRAMAYELAPLGIRVNGIAPGVIDTDMAPQDPTASLPEIPLGRLARPEEVAKYVSFVGGPVSSYTTGEIIYVDGGFRLP